MTFLQGAYQITKQFQRKKLGSPIKTTNFDTVGGGCKRICAQDCPTPPIMEDFTPLINLQVVALGPLNFPQNKLYSTVRVTAPEQTQRHKHPVFQTISIFAEIFLQLSFPHCSKSHSTPKIWMGENLPCCSRE